MQRVSSRARARAVRRAYGRLVWTKDHAEQRRLAAHVRVEARVLLDEYRETAERTGETPQKYIMMLLRDMRCAMILGDYDDARRLALVVIDEFRDVPRRETRDPLMSDRGVWLLDWDSLADAHSVMGEVALIEGNIREAEEHLLLSADLPSSLVRKVRGANLLLAHELFDAGRHDVVEQYLLTLRAREPRLGKKIDRQLQQVRGGHWPSGM